MPVADALRAVLAGAQALPEEMIALDAAYHRVLARDVAALRTQPPQAMSAMDGYAVRSADAADTTARRAGLLRRRSVPAKRCGFLPAA
jgi:molybdopterin molybdotransferase